MSPSHTPLAQNPATLKPLTLLIIALALACSTSTLAQPVELMIDVDAFDNFSEPQLFDTEYYGPEQIKDFFQRCQQNGVKTVYWRCHSQITSYRSKLNYNCADEPIIRSRSDTRRHSGALAAKIGISSREGGLSQKVQTQPDQTYRLQAWVAAPPEATVSLVVKQAKDGTTLKRKKLQHHAADNFSHIELTFKGAGLIQAAVIAQPNAEPTTFIVDDISLTNSNGDELIINGSMENFSRLEPTNWDASTADFITLNGDVTAMPEDQREKLIPNAQQHLRLIKHAKRTTKNRQRVLNTYDPLAEAVKQAHAHHIKIYGWLDPLDDGRRMLPSIGTPWASKFMEKHPQYRLVDQQGNRRWGQLCFGYPQVRKYKTAAVKELLDYNVDGIYLKTAYQHNTIWDGNNYEYTQFAYNDVALAEYDKQWGHPDDNEYKLERLKDIHGDFFIQWIKEMAQVVHEHGKKLSFSMQPGNRLRNLNGAWKIDWRYLITQSIIDELLIEPRISGSHERYFTSLDRQYQYAQLCRKHHVKLGFDFYHNALAERRVKTTLAQENPHDYFIQELLELARSPIDFIGIYEGMYVNQKTYWPAIKAVSQKIPQIPQSQKIPPAVPTDPQAQNHKNWALASAQATATIKVNDDTINALELINGDLSNVSNIAVTHLPFELTIDFPTERMINSLRIYPGVTSNAHNPSGECGLKAYRLLALVNDQWLPIAEPVTNAPRMLETNAATEYEFYYQHQLPNPLKAKAVKLIVEKSSDTGMRIRCRNTPCVPENNRVVHLREIQVFAPK